MQKPRPRPESTQTTAARQPSGVPEAQARALDRKHNLDEQQRGFSNGVPAPHFPSRRPPG